MPRDPPRLDALPQRQRPVRHHQLLVKHPLRPQPRTGRAGPVGIVERERTRLQLLKRDHAVRAGVLLGKERLGGLPVRPDRLDPQDPHAQLERQLHRIGQPTPDRRARHQPVHHRVDMMLLVLVQRRHVIKRHHLAVHPHPDEPLPADRREDILMPPLLAPDQRRQQDQFGLLRQGEQLIDNLLRALPLHRFPAFRAVRPPDRSIQQTQIIMHLRHRRHDRTRIVPRRPLLNRNRRRQPLDLIDLRFLHLVQKLARVCRKTLHIPPLPLGIERVERERRLPRTAQPGNHRQTVPRNPDIDIFQIVLPRPGNDNVAHETPRYPQTLNPSKKRARFYTMRGD